MATRKLSQILSVNVAAILAAGTIADATPPTSSRVANKDKTTSSNKTVSFHRLVDRDADATNNCHRIFSGQSSSHHALCEGVRSETEPQRFDRALAYHRSQLSTYRQKWEYSAGSSATTSTKTPSRSWPDDVPPEEDLSFLLEDIKYCDRSDKFNPNGNYYCNALRFRVASALLMQHEEESQRKGLELLKTLAKKEHSDAMVFYGMCLNEGRVDLEPNPKAAVSYFERCSSGLHDHPQAQYELGVSYYTGEGVTENEAEAVRLFQLAAEKQHPAACYMLGDCLLDGIGVDVDRSLALEWLVKAAELGHRGARSRVMAVLEKREGEDYNGFTDASRQTILSEPSVSKESDNRNPTELIRRQTIVSKSRKES